MIGASTQLRTLIASGCYGRADLYTISPAGVDAIALTSADQDIAWNGVVHRHGLLRTTRDRLRNVAGLETDTFSLTLTVDPLSEMTVNGVPFRQAAQWGLLDGARIDLDWAYVDGWGSPPEVVGVLTRFVGLASEIAVDRAGVKISCKSWLSLLDTQVPSQVYQAHCRFMLGDSHCGVDVSSHGVNGTVTALGSTSLISTSLTDASGTWNQGYVTFTSGVNKGVSKAVRAQTGGTLTLAGPLPWSPAVGDAFTVYPGCDKTMPTFQKISNTVGVPTTAPYRIAVAGFIQNYGVSQLTTQAGLWGFAPVSKWQAMALVGAAPAKGQYCVSTTGVYSFAAADAGSSVNISYRSVGSGCSASCWAKFHNPERFGGMPFIPAPETAT